jgi:hypothetical protein
MAWNCGSCGQLTSRGSQTFDHKGVMVREVCPHCDPARFEGAFRDPSDQKIYSGPQAMPTLYKQDKHGVYQAKDELISDTVEKWDKGPTERAKELKRATRRTEPLTAEELERTRIWGEKVLGPLLRAEGMGAVVGALQPEESETSSGR